MKIKTFSFLTSSEKEILTCRLTDRPIRPMRALLRSPLLHFVSLGALVYVAQAVTQAPPADPQTALTLSGE